MTSDQQGSRKEAYDFILSHIDSVPHLEALLLLWNRRPRVWTAAQAAELLYISTDAADRILRELVRQRLIAESASTYYYSPSQELDTILGLVDETYRRELVPVTLMIHSKASQAVRDFARAFRFTKGGE